MRLLDATALALLMDKDARPPGDPATGQPLTHAHKRLAFLEEQVRKSNDTLLIPTPALAEVLVGLGDAGPAVLDRIDKSARFKVVDFDTRAAVELAAMTREAILAGDKKAGSLEPWQKVKFDRQIIAIARVYGVSVVYSDDGGVRTFASQVGLPVVSSWELPLPPEDPPTLFDDQLSMPSVEQAERMAARRLDVD